MCKLPVLKQLRSMKMPPLQDECKRSPLHLAAHASVGDPDRDVGAGVPRVKVRRIVLAVIDRDDDSEEAADLRHDAILHTNKDGRPFGRPFRVMRNEEVRIVDSRHAHGAHI